MKDQQFDVQEYSKLKHRVEQLKSRVELDRGPEQETARRLLLKIQKKLKKYEETHNIPNYTSDDYNTTNSQSYTNTKKQNTGFTSKWNSYQNFNAHSYQKQNDQYSKDTRIEADIIRELGIIYMIFGSTYQTLLNYHIYKIRFKRKTHDQGSFARVYSDIYEDDIRICEDVIIGFWPLKYGDDRCRDIEFSSMHNYCIKKYDNGCSVLYEKLINELKDIWNTYFDEQSDVPLLSGKIDNYLETGTNYYALEKELSKDERKQIVSKVENELKNVQINRLKLFASPIVIWAYDMYKDLNEFLEQSGVVYIVKSDGIYIWNYIKNDYGKLVGYQRATNRYDIYLI